MTTGGMGLLPGMLIRIRVVRVVDRGPSGTGGGGIVAAWWPLRVLACGTRTVLVRAARTCGRSEPVRCPRRTAGGGPPGVAAAPMYCGRVGG